jgi:hypothetical protein
VLALVLALPGAGGAEEAPDPELERLKAAANEVQAALEVTERTFQKEGLTATETLFKIDTGQRKFVLRYNTFSGAQAAENPKLLNDWSSGYGLIVPQPGWYQNGLLRDVVLRGPGGMVQLLNTEGRPRVLAAGGGRIAYDLVFTRPEGIIVVRTVALGGREELLIRVSGKLAGDPAQTLSTEFYAFPQGHTAPLDRWVHGAGQDLQNVGQERKQFPWDLSREGAWMLLCDHAKAPGDSPMGPVGLIYDPAALTSAAVLHNRNYPIIATFTGPATAEQGYLLYTFGPQPWEEARRRLAEIKDAGELLARAFAGLPPALGE